MILLCTFKSLIKIVEPKNTEFLCGKVVSGKSVLYNWRRREKSTVIHEPCTINFLEKILQRFFFSESIIDFTDFIWFILLGLFCRYYCYLWPEVGVRMFCKVFFRSCIIVFSAIMDKTRNFLHCSAKNFVCIECRRFLLDHSTTKSGINSLRWQNLGLIFRQKKSSEWRSVEASSALCLQFEISTFH